MAFAERRRSDLHKLGFGAWWRHRGNRIAHAGAQPADELGILKASEPLYGTCLDAFGHELLNPHVGLTVTSAAPGPMARWSPSAIYFVGSPW